MKSEMTSHVQSGLAAIKADAEALGRVAQASVTHTDDSSSSGFIASFGDVMQRMNAQDKAASDKMADVDAGRSDDLVGAMLASQQASLSFSMLLQVRNKVVGAVEDLIKLPI